jgi:small conductance mechanosensitive channel
MTLLAQAQPDSVPPFQAPDLVALLDPAVLVPAIARVVIVTAVAFVLYRLARTFIRRFISREVEEDDPVVKRLREQRMRTLGSLAQSVLAVIITIITLLTILGTFMPIGPILASVGVLGLAVSFGAQSLVKDVITGTFMLVESQFAIGDIVRIGDVGGIVEKITLRTVVLRDLHGVVHIIPNGEITRVSNMTKSWSRTVLDIGVAYKSDVDHVIAVLKDIGEAFNEDPEWGAQLVEPPEVPGVEAFGDSAIVVRMMTKTLPLRQFDVGRELRRRIKKRFDAEGIEIPFPHVTFYWGDRQMPPALSEDAGRLFGAEHKST